jgi:hypothetical protein
LEPNLVLDLQNEIIIIKIRVLLDRKHSAIRTTAAVNLCPKASVLGTTEHFGAKGCTHAPSTVLVRVGFHVVTPVVMGYSAM